MTDCQEFCLRWNNFQSNITHQFETLRDDEDFVDVTLTTGGKCIKAHKVVLSACSPYFKELLKNNPCKHPIIFMRDVEFSHLKALVAFMYAGVVNVEQAELASFLKTAEALHILGLTEAPQLHRDIKNFPTGSKSGSCANATNTSSPPSGNSAAVSSGSREEGEEGGRTSPSESPAKRSKTSHSNCGVDQDGGGGSRRWSGSVTGSIGETEENAVQPGSIVPASSLFQPSRGGLVITPAEPAEPTEPRDNDLDQSYNDDLVDMLEPKTELPDYSSDGESRTDAGSYLDNSGDVHGFGTMNDIMSATSTQGATGQDGQPIESYQAALRKLHSLDPRPCPICQRMYSNLSNLRQHMRLIHIPQSVECPLCSRSFKTKLYLRRHLLSFHDIPVKWENSAAGGAGNQNPAGANIISGLMSQANTAPNQNAPTWSTSTTSSTNSSTVISTASVSLTAAPRASVPTGNAVSGMAPPLPHAYINVEEELKRTYLQSPHRVRSSCSVTLATESRQDDSNSSQQTTLGQHCLASSVATQSTTATAVHSSPAKEENSFSPMSNPFQGGVPLLQPKTEHIPDFMRSRFSGEGSQQSQLGQFGGRVNYSNVNVPYSENT